MAKKEMLILSFHCIFTSLVLSQTNTFTSPLDLINITEKRQPYPHVCTLRIVIDHTLIHRSRHNKPLHRLIDEIHNIVSASNKIFESINFTKYEEGRDLSLYIHDFLIYHDINNSPFHNEHLNPYKFLQRFQHISSQDVCLAIAFTYRIFPSNILGLGYEFPKGGACHKTCNKIVITLQNDKYLPLTFKQIVYTLTHEIAHAFGALSDAIERYGRRKCKIIIGDKFFIHSHEIPKPLKLKNMQFSECFLRDIKIVLPVVRSNCLTYEYPVCGNGKKDYDEECDCGRKEYCSLIDPCCMPPSGIGNYRGCHLKRRSGSQCSYRDECCTSDCHFVSEYTMKRCPKPSSCYLNTYCNGNSSICTDEPTMKNDSTKCNQELGECFDGKCRLIACKRYNMTDCKCPKHKDACKVCCKRKDLCLPTTQWGIDFKNESTILPVGNKCMEGLGLCTLSGKCVIPIKSHTIKDIRSFEDEYKVLESKWSAVTHILMGLIFLVGLIILLALIFLAWKLLGTNRSIVLRNCLICHMHKK